MEILKLGKVFSNANDAETRQSEMLDQANNYQLASNGGYLTIVKYAIYAMLAILNFRLFNSAIPGGWGAFVGLIAIMMEGFAIWCWNNQSKSAGNHRKALIGFCIAFTVASVAHAAASVYELVNGTVPLGPSISHYVFWYSHVVAFPLIFGLQIFALFVIGFTHYQARIAKERAESQVEIEKGQAQLHTRTAKLKQESDLAEQEVLFHRKTLQAKSAMTGLLADTVKEEGRQIEVLRSVEDPLIRRRLAEMFGFPDLADAPVMAKQKGTMTMAPPVQSSFTQSGASNYYVLPTDEPGK